MKLAGEVSVRAPREQVFNAIKDARFFASCVDGVQDLTEIDATRYAAVFQTRIAYMTFKFAVTVEMTKTEPPHLIEAKVEGKPMGLVGRFSATTKTRLSEDGVATRIAYEIDSVLTGKLGSMGQPVLKAKAKEMERTFAARLKERLES